MKNPASQNARKDNHQRVLIMGEWVRVRDLQGRRHRPQRKVREPLKQTAPTVYVDSRKNTRPEPFWKRAVTAIKNRLSGGRRGV